MKFVCAVLLLPFLSSCSPGIVPASGAKTEALAIPAVSHQPRPAPAKTARSRKTPTAPAKPALPTYQCLFNDEHLAHLRVAMDRSGTKVPALEYSGHDSGYYIGLHWEDAPEGMDYKEEVFGSWRGRQIVASSYQGVSPEEWSENFLSLEDESGVLRPFLHVTKDLGGVFKFEHDLVTSPSGGITGMHASWLYSGTGVFSIDADFVFRPDGAHLQELLVGGRGMPFKTRTYNLAGKVIRTRLEPRD